MRARRSDELYAHVGTFEMGSELETAISTPSITVATIGDADIDFPVGEFTFCRAASKSTAKFV